MINKPTNGTTSSYDDVPRAGGEDDSRACDTDFRAGGEDDSRALIEPDQSRSASVAHKS